jgi:hypothetical protein
MPKIAILGAGSPRRENEWLLATFLIGLALIAFFHGGAWFVAEHRLEAAGIHDRERAELEAMRGQMLREGARALALLGLACLAVKLGLAGGRALGRRRAAGEVEVPPSSGASASTSADRGSGPRRPPEAT